MNKKSSKSFGVLFAISLMLFGTANVSALEERGVTLESKSKSRNGVIQDVLDYTHSAHFVPNSLGTKCSVSQDVEITDTAFGVGRVIYKAFQEEDNGFTGAAKIKATKFFVEKTGESRLYY